jgi:cytochrome b561
MKIYTPPIISRLWLTLAMTLLYVAALGCRMTGAVAHEWIGLTFCVLSVLHMLINLRWFKGIPKGRYNFRRYVNTILNMLLPITITVMCVTGILGSRHVFGFLDLKGGMDIRQLHTLSAYWGLVLLGIHTGMQWVKVLAGLRNVSGFANLMAMNNVRRCLALLLAAYGTWAFFDRDMGSKLFMGFSFDFWDTAKPELLFYTHNFAIMALYASITHYTLKFTAKIATDLRGAVATETTRP